MAKVLVVEDSKTWKDIYRTHLGELVGEENLDIIGDFEKAGY